MYSDLFTSTYVIVEHTNQYAHNLLIYKEIKNMNTTPISVFETMSPAFQPEFKSSLELEGTLLELYNQEVEWLKGIPNMLGSDITRAKRYLVALERVLLGQVGLTYITAQDLPDYLKDKLFKFK